MLQSGVLLSSG